jgi:two-component system, OmpR family, response regulator MprA
MRQILVASNETSFLHGLNHRLAPYDIEVLAAQSGEQALRVLLDNSPELVVLSEHLPDLHAHEVCRLIRAEGYTDLPVVLLSEGGELRDIIAGLESGADSVLPWPLSEDELIERIRARLHYTKTRGGGHQRFQVGNLIFDTQAHQVWCNGQALPLSKREYELLKLLASNAGHVLTKEVIFERIWGPDSTANPENIKVYIHLLRRKLSACGEEHIIHALRFIGYVLKPSNSTRPPRNCGPDGPHPLSIF